VNKVDIELPMAHERVKISDSTSNVLLMLAGVIAARAGAEEVPRTGFISLEITQEQALARTNQDGFLIGGERLT
jgi:hypothetical protein